MHLFTIKPTGYGEKHFIAATESKRIVCRPFYSFSLMHAFSSLLFEFYVS